MDELIRKSDAIAALGEEPLVWCDGEEELAEREQWRRDVAAVKAVPTIEPERKWIPVSERMPEAGSWAIWCSNKGIIQVARWKTDLRDHFFPDQGFFDLEDAVAWMELPEPWKGENHDSN